MKPMKVRARMRLALVGVAVTAFAVTTLPPPAAADDTPLPNTVTPVGSL